MMIVHDVKQEVMTLFCDNLNIINFPNNLIQHSMLKHTYIRYHSIRNFVKKSITLEHGDTKNQLNVISTKDLVAAQFKKLKEKLGICLFKEL